MIRKASLVPTAMLCVATVAFPCGSSSSYAVEGPLYTTATFAERAVSPMYDFDAYTRAEVKILPGLVRADSARFAALIGRSPLESTWRDTLLKPRVAEPTRSAIDAAWTQGNPRAAETAARAAVAVIMSLPSSDDLARDSVLRLAVETIELAPVVLRAASPASGARAAFTRLAAPLRAVPIDSMPALLARSPDSPRRATLEYAAMRLAIRDGIPNDTREEIAKQVPAARWDSLHAAHRAWLSRNAEHPYAGLVKFSRLRLFFLASQPDSAWSTVVTLYAEYPARAAAEMRYLLQVGVPTPSWLLDETRAPIELRAALVGNMVPSAEAWRGLMRSARRTPTAPWAEGLEERLLAVLASDTLRVGRGIVATDIPAWRASASPFWRYMWAVNMLRLGRLDDARQFTTRAITPQQDSLLFEDAAMLSARIHMMRGDWVSALQVPQVDVWTRRYMLRVLAPDSAAALLLSARDTAVVRDARRVLAMRAAQAGRWSDAAALVRPVDAGRAAQYLRVGALAADTASNAGLQRFARGAAAAHGRMFFESTRYFYRGMMQRDYALAPANDGERWDLPWSRAEERRRMNAYLRSGSERYLALRAYASYLGRAGVTSAQRAVAVREADRVYRGLIDTDPSRNDSGFWADSLPVSAEARVIRRAGRR